ncbi:MAG: T9SS type A sorting domain-containing protein [Saprospiraceae bacterium]
MNTGKLTLPLLLSILFFSTSHLAAQMELKLQLLEDLKWGVFARPANISIDSATITGSGQVTLVMPTGYQWGNLTSIHGKWSASSGTVDSPIENADRMYISIGLSNAEPAHPIPYHLGEETLLFTFEGNGTCPEFMHLIDCGTPSQSDPFCPPNSEGSNPGNDLSVIEFAASIEYYNFSDNYALHAWDCHDNDSDGIPNAIEDTNGNGIYDSGDASDLNDPNVQAPDHQLSHQDAHLPGYTMGLTGQNDPSKAIRSVHSQQNFTLSPNPPSDVLFVKFGGETLSADATLYLMNSQGIVLQKIKTDASSNQQIDISGLPSGLYVVAIKDGSGFFKNQRFVKK